MDKSSERKAKWAPSDWPSYWASGRGADEKRIGASLMVAKISTFKEPAREIKVLGEADVIVVGGGPAGVGAAIAAARNGARTALVERYGFLGGMATGALVTCIMPMSDGTRKQGIAGICQEIIDRLDVTKSVLHPRKEEIGSSDKRIVKRWKPFLFFQVQGKIRMAAVVDPEMTKCVLNEMVEEAGVKLFLHSWGTRAIVNDGRIQGVIFESKSGRQAILGKIVIDTTGDGDIFASAGADFDDSLNLTLRSSMLALCFLLGNVNVRKVMEFKDSQPERHEELMRELAGMGGFTMYLRTWRDDIIWFNNYIPGVHALRVEDLTWVEVNARKTMLMTFDFFKSRIPGFEKSFILKTASQVGTRCSRRLIGQYVVTEQDIRSGKVHEDTIAVCPPFMANVSPDNPNMCVPYRSLVARNVDHLLVAGRCFSADLFANNLFSPIQFCIAMGQAAGTAAALASKKRMSPRDVDHKILQKTLLGQGVPLPF